MINRFMLRHRSINPILTPIVIIEPVVLPLPNPIPETLPHTHSYTLADFGENAINNHHPSDAWHSERNQLIFNYITKAFRERCTSYQSYQNSALGNTLIGSGDVLKDCKILKADMVYTPYVNSAVWMNVDYQDFVLHVGAHFDNNGQIAEGENGNRHDITANKDTFLQYSIAVSSRRDTPEDFKKSTSFGFGMEFFEDCSAEGLDTDYPDKDIDTAFAELLSIDGVNLTSTVHPNFSDSLIVGEEITIRFSDNNYQNTFITEIVDGGHIVVSPAISPISTPSIYGWHKTTLGGYMWGQAESWAIPIVAGKLKVIKMTTGADWDTVRNAARVTAKRNTTNIPEIDNANWDIYRGFGQIQMNDAIAYINNL